MTSNLQTENTKVFATDKTNITIGGFVGARSTSLAPNGTETITSSNVIEIDTEKCDKYVKIYPNITKKTNKGESHASEWNFPGMKVTHIPSGSSTMVYESENMHDKSSSVYHNDIENDGKEKRFHIEEIDDDADIDEIRPPPAGLDINSSADLTNKELSSNRHEQKKYEIDDLDEKQVDEMQSILSGAISGNSTPDNLKTAIQEALEELKIAKKGFSEDRYISQVKLKENLERIAVYEHREDDEHLDLGFSNTNADFRRLNELNLSERYDEKSE